MSNKLVTYGTLMNPIWGLTFIPDSAGYMSGDMYSLGRYPAVTRLGTDSHFFYKLAEITPDLLPQLDMYEGTAYGLYKRELTSTPFGDAWIYIYNQQLPAHANLIMSWKQK